jgi:hypothetical protein
VGLSVGLDVVEESLAPARIPVPFPQNINRETYELFPGNTKRAETPIRIALSKNGLHILLFANHVMHLF